MIKNICTVKLYKMVSPATPERPNDALKCPGAPKRPRKGYDRNGLEPIPMGNLNQAVAIPPQVAFQGLRLQ